MNIKIYKKDGNLDSIEGLTNENFKKIMGMLCKVLLKNGDMQEGYIDPLRTKGDCGEFDGTVHDYIYLWTFNNLDEENQKYDTMFDVKKEVECSGKIYTRYLSKKYL